MHVYILGAMEDILAVYRKRTPQKHGKIVEAAIILEEFVVDVEELVADFIVGVVHLLMSLFNLVREIIFLLGVGFIWMIICDAVVYGALALGYIVQGILDFIDLVIKALNTVAGGISSGINAIGSLFHAPHVGSFHIPLISVSDVMGGWWNTVLEIDTTCASLDTWQIVLSAFGKVIFSPRICPLLRFTSVTPIVGVPLSFFLGWASFPWLPIPAENCQEPPDEVLCMWLKFWIVILYFIIQLLIIITFVRAFKKFEYKVINIIWPLIRFIGHLIRKYLL